MNPKAPPVIGQDWLTTPPITMEQLRGRVSIVLFWSVGCEASMVRLLELEELVARRVESLSVLAVHSPRFAYERDEGVIEDTLARLQLQMPVVHDPELLTWARYNPGGWPAAIVIDHRGRTIGASLGLDDLDPLVEAAEMAIMRAEMAVEQKKVRRAELPEPVVRSRPAGPEQLAWPSGLAVLPPDPEGGPRLAVVDSGNDRVLVLALDHERRSARVTASFDRLPGVRRVCAVSTSELAVSLPDRGQVIQLDLAGGRRPKVLADDLERPQGLALDLDGSLVIADSCDGQLVRVGADGRVGVIAGNGCSGSSDGPAPQAELAQPVAVTRTASGLVFLDAATSNVRILTDNGRVHTLTGNSFERFGLLDGPVHLASLQRPTGLTAEPDGSVVVADTGNNRLRRIADRRVRTLGLAGLSRPEDIVYVDGSHADPESPTGGNLIVADTGNHRLIVVDGSSRTAWKLELGQLFPSRAQGRSREREVVPSLSR